MSYSIIIGTANRTTLLIAGTLSYTLQANHDDTASCALLTTAAGFIPAVGQSFYVYESVDAENKFGGVINTVTIEKLEAGVSTSKALRVEMTISPFKAIASRRTVNYSETAVTAKTIVQKVISALSTDGVTEGTVNTGASDIGEYDAPLNTCSQIMDDMCTASGYQWWIDPDKLLHFYNFDLVISAPYTVTETGNYTVDSYSYDIDQYANKIFVQGHPDVSAVITRQDTAEQTARAAIEGGSGIYGATIIDENIVTETDANAAGDAALKWAGIIPQKLVFTAYDNLSSWYPGYRVTANLPSIGLTANTSFNIDSVMTSDQGTYFQAQVNCSVRKSDSFSNAQAQTGIEYLGKLVNGVSSGVSSGVSIDETTGAITPVVKGVVQVWVATALSTLAKNNDVFVDTDDYSQYDMTAYSTTGTVTSASGEYIELTGTAACTLTITSPGTAAGTCTKYIKNSSSQSWTIGATVDGTANYTLAANLGVALYWNNTDWRSFAGGGAGGGQTASFTSIIVSGQSTILATTAAGTLEFVQGTGITIATNTSNKTVTFNATVSAFATASQANATHTGDVTGSAALTIAAEAVTYAKMQHISATDKLLGRVTAGAGDPEEIACTAAGRALLDDTTAAAQLITLGVNATAAELNILDGATLTVTELNYIDGVTSAIQTQLNSKATATANITDHSVVRGAGGAKGVQGSGILVDDSNNLTGIAAATLSGLLTLSGGQIKFPSAQNASADANTLDDYEEGTWTPSITSTAGSISSASATGRYIKIGEKINIYISVSIVNKGTATGDIILTLPIAPNTDYRCPGSAREVNYIGVSCIASIVSDGKLHLAKYDGGTLLVNEYTIVGCMFYFPAA